jgi:hypothetical protein
MVGVGQREIPPDIRDQSMGGEHRLQRFFRRSRTRAKRSISMMPVVNRTKDGTTRPSLTLAAPSSTPH